MKRSETGMSRRDVLIATLTGGGLVGATSLGLLPAFAAPKPPANQSVPPAKPGEKAARKPRAAPTAKPAGRPTVAVLYFDYAGKDEELAVLKKGLAQMLISDLSRNERIQLVERARLESVLAELKLGGSRKVDSKTAAQIGKLLGAEYLVLGSYFSLLGSLRIDARLVAVQTGRIILSTGASGKVDEFLTIQTTVASALALDLAKRLPRREAAAARAGSARGVGGVRPGAAGASHRRPSRPRRPKRLRTQTAVQFAKALDAKDRGDKVAAKALLTRVVKEQPDFGMARQELAAFVQ